MVAKLKPCKHKKIFNDFIFSFLFVLKLGFLKNYLRKKNIQILGVESVRLLRENFIFVRVIIQSLGIIVRA